MPGEVAAALAEPVAPQRRFEFLHLRGRVHWEGDLDESRLGFTHERPLGSYAGSSPSPGSRLSQLASWSPIDPTASPASRKARRKRSA